MRILETDINDIQIENFNESKLKLTEEIINYIQPIFSKEYKEKIKEIKLFKKFLISKKDEINQEKIELESLFKIFNKKNKERELLVKMGKLVQTGLIQESMKNELVTLLKSFENLPEEKISSYLNETIVLLSQKFAKS